MNFDKINFEIKTYGPDEKYPCEVILPNQTHGANIVEIVSGKEDLSDCDGIWTESPQPPLTRGSFTLGVQTADCAPICFWEKGRYGIVHAGWRGLCNGIIEKMLGNFQNPQIWVGPILPKFEIQKDFCYEELFNVFGDEFFEKTNGTTVLFDFKSALQSIIPTAKFDLRSTQKSSELASWRRDKDEKRNVTVISLKFL